MINTKRGDEEADETSIDWVKTELDPWKTFEDEKVTSYNLDNLKVDTFGGSSNVYDDPDMEQYWRSDNLSYGKNAYILVYERKHKSPLREVQTEDKASLECANTAPSEPISEE